jgi:hypothetical protein
MSRIVTYRVDPDYGRDETGKFGILGWGASRAINLDKVAYASAAICGITSIRIGGMTLWIDADFNEFIALWRSSPP